MLKIKKKMLHPKLSTKKIKFILSGKKKKPDKRAFFIALNTAMFAMRAAMINAKPCIDAFGKIAKGLEIAELALNFAESMKSINIKKATAN
jgi:hypothetical protein